jgi:ABC-2 type transport system ATP-binding protein
VDAIATVGLTKVYGAGLAGRGSAARAVDGVTLDIHQGEIFGFLGPNGSGKTTLIRLLLGFLHPTAGRASVLGFDTVRNSVSIRRRVGYLPGGIALYDGMTGRGLLDYLARLGGGPAPLRDELCERLGLEGRDLGRPIRDYSRGMRQKVGIVQALQHDPELAILDEPSEGLDPLVQQAFYAILEDLCARGRTIFFSSHVLSEVERICDRVAIVRDGRLVALEDVAGLLAHRTRRVEVRFQGAPPALGDVPALSDVRVDVDRVTARLAGDARPLLAALRGADVLDLAIEPGSLEEAFLEYYSDGGGKVASEPPGAGPSPRATR